MSGISRQEVERVLALARLSVGDDELLRMAKELDAVLDYVETLEGADTEGVPPTAHVIPLATPMRKDVAAPPLDPELAMRNAPDHEGSAFVVPKVIDGEDG